jgi:hypothetical protein
MTYTTVFYNEVYDHLIIDGGIFLYYHQMDTKYIKTILHSIDGRSIMYILNTHLPLNYKNPKETIDTFFKLLILQ